MRYREYTSTTLAQMQTKRWRTVRLLTNGYVSVPAGMEVEITSKRNGLNISGQPCSACGVKVFVGKVSPSDLEEISDLADDRPIRVKDTSKWPPKEK